MRGRSSPPPLFGKLDQGLEDRAKRRCRNRLTLVGDLNRNAAGIAMDAEHHGLVQVSVLRGVEQEIGKQLMQPDTVEDARGIACGL